MRLPVSLVASAAVCALFLVPVPGAFAQNAAPGALPASSAQWHTNAENVRRIAPGRDHVAFATSGGVRVWDRNADAWRLVTMNDGLPANNVYDVAFDPDSPDTLWALCGDWVKLDTDPMPRLRLATIDLAGGAVSGQGGPSGVAPRTPRTYQYWLDYRLAVGKDVAAVTAGNRAVLAFDRATSLWLDRVPADAPLARASHLPGVSATVTDYIANARHAAALMSNGVYLYDRGTDTWSPRPFPRANDPRVVNGATVIESMIGRSGTLRFAGESGAVTFEGLSFRIRRETRQGQEQVTTENTSGRFRVNPATTGILMEQKGPSFSMGSGTVTGTVLAPRRPAPAVPSATPPAPFPPPRPRPQITYCTDLVGDGKYLWVAGYNQPFRARSGGIARLDMETGEWHHPTPPGGLAANVGSLTRFRSGTIAHVGNGSSLYDRAKRAFASATDGNRLRDDLMASAAMPQRRSMPDPRLAPDERGIPISLIGSLDEHTSLAYAPEEPFRFVVDGQPNRGMIKPSVTFLYDHRTQELTPISSRIPEMKGFRPQLIRRFGESVFLAGETTRPAPPVLAGQNAPTARLPMPEPPLLTVWQWNPKTGEARMAQRVTWAESQRERDARNRRFRELLERRRRGSREPLVMEPTPDMNLIEVAGRLWLMWERRLYRYDPQTDAWMAEGMADSVHAESAPAAASLWALVHAGNGRPGVARYWNARTGWQRVQVDEVTASMLAAVAPDGDTLWFGGVGVVAVPRATLRFTPEEPEP